MSASKCSLSAGSRKVPMDGHLMLCGEGLLDRFVPALQIPSTLPIFLPSHRASHSISRPTISNPILPCSRDTVKTLPKLRYSTRTARPTAAMAHLFTSSACKSRTSSASHSTHYPLSDLNAPSAPHRTFSEPIAYSSSRRTSSCSSSMSRSSTLTDMSKSAEHMSSAEEDKFGFARSGTSRSEDKTRRRRSNDPKINVYTECGRHSDDWLFGGFSVSGTMKMLWDRRE